MSNTDGAGVTGEVSTMDEPKKETPKKWKQPHQSDARKAKSTGSYPDYFSWKTRSGHVFQLDDSKGGETVTLQHRGGTAVQMAPDGSLHITAHNGKYEITFGENRMTISGAQDITVKGDASMRVYGDYNVTCQKDYNLTVLGNFNVTAKNHNRHILGNMDTQARNENKKLMGSSSKIARGAIAYVAKGSVTHASQSDQIFLGGAAGANLWAKKGNITQNIEEEGDFHSEAKNGEYHVKAKKAIKVQSTDETMDFKSKNEFTMTSTDKSGKIKTKQDLGVESENSGIQIKAQQNIGMTSTSGNIQSEAQAGNISAKAQNGAEVVTQSGSLDLRSGGQASLSGTTTYVSGQTTTNIKGGTSVNVDGPSALNLNGGMSQIMSALGLFQQLSFNFPTAGNAEGDTGSSRGVHAPDKPAGRNEADNWA